MEEPIEILVVDDNERNLLAMEALLEGLGVQVVTARSGAEALRLLLGRVYPVILLDVHMPGMDGFETARHIRAAPTTRHIPIIFVTADLEVERAAIGYAQGAVDYLLKPIIPEVLRTKVSVFVELHRAKLREQELRVEQERQRWEAERLRDDLEKERATAGALGASLAQAERALAARDQVLRIASHELRTPLTSMKISVDNTLRRAAKNPAEVGSNVARTLKVLGSQIERLAKLVEELLSAVVIQAGRLRLAPTPVDLAGLVRTTIEDLQHSIEASGSLVGITVQRPGAVNADAFWLQQAVGNLLTNALKFGGGKPIHVVVDVDPELRRGRVVVRDEGIGIPLDRQAQIFEPFEHAKSAENYGGIGLGLFIVRRIVEEHGGRVSVASEPGRGAAFTIDLPAGA